jgi:hypothetical protein
LQLALHVFRRARLISFIRNKFVFQADLTKSISGVYQGKAGWDSKLHVNHLKGRMVVLISSVALEYPFGAFMPAPE